MGAVTTATFTGVVLPWGNSASCSTRWNSPRWWRHRPSLSARNGRRCSLGGGHEARYSPRRVPGDPRLERDPVADRARYGHARETLRTRDMRELAHDGAGRRSGVGRSCNRCICPSRDDLPAWRARSASSAKRVESRFVGAVVWWHAHCWCAGRAARGRGSRRDDTTPGADAPYWTATPMARVNPVELSPRTRWSTS